MFNPSRQDARLFYVETWQKYQRKLPLLGSESTAIGIILDHPEYHALLSQSEHLQTRDYPPEQGATNPYLHLSMHLAIQEQLAINQPVGIQDYYQRLLARHQSASKAQHEIMDCLAEMIWQAQQLQTGFDALIYFACLDKKLSAAF